MTIYLTVINGFKVPKSKILNNDENENVERKKWSIDIIIKATITCRFAEPFRAMVKFNGVMFKIIILRRF